MNTHDRTLIAYLAEHPAASVDALTAQLGVRERTLFSYIKHANGELGPAAQIVYERDGESGAGYYLVVEDEQTYRNLLLAGEVEGAVPQTRDERVSYLINDLLSRSGYITLDELSGMLYVSRTTLSADMRLVEQALDRFGLTLEKRPHYGMRVTGPEMARRLCLADVAIGGAGRRRSPEARGALQTIGLGESGEDRRLLDVVSGCVDEALEAESFHINSLLYRNLLVHVCIAVMRIRAGHYVPLEGIDDKGLRASSAWPVARRIAHLIERDVPCELPESEVAYITMHLAGKRVLNGGTDDGGEGLVIPDEVWNVVGEMVERIRSDFLFDFSSDLELRMNLARHIVPLATRLRHHLSMNNPILADIKARYPLAFAMASDVSYILADTFGSMPSEDEVGYIALAFALAVERQKTGLARKSIVIVCASGQGSARLLAYRYREEFGSYLDRIVTCDVSEVDALDLTGIDYVFTTVPLHRQLSVPVREVGLFLDEGDIARVREVFRGVGEDQGERPLLLTHFDPSLFFVHLKMTSKEEVLDLLCDEAAQRHALDARFRELVARREELAPTAFGNLVALPHPITPASDDTFFGVALLDQPITWDGRDVQAVFLLSIARTDHEGLDRFFDQLSDVLMDPKAIAHLVSDQRLETLVEICRAIPSKKGDQL